MPVKQGEGMESVIYLPLRIEQRVIGCLSVQSPRQHAYNAAHLEFVRALASYTAIALDNADNYRRLDHAMGQTRDAMASMQPAKPKATNLVRSSHGVAELPSKWLRSLTR